MKIKTNQGRMTKFGFVNHLLSHASSD